jgi:hypothetical protein
MISCGCGVCGWHGRRPVGYGATYQGKFPENLDGRIVLVVDMGGHSQTQVSVLKMRVTPTPTTSEIPADEDIQEEKIDKERTTTPRRRLSSTSDNNDNKTTIDLSIEYLLSVPFGPSPQAKDDLLWMRRMWLAWETPGRLWSHVSRQVSRESRWKNRIGRRYGRTQSNASVGVENASHTNANNVRDTSRRGYARGKDRQREDDDSSTPTIEY